jgi:hypothetical protein
MMENPMFFFNRFEVAERQAEAIGFILKTSLLSK